MNSMLDGAQSLSQSGSYDTSTLERLVDLHVEFAVGDRALLGVWVREQRALSEEVRRSLRPRQRAYEQVWREVVHGLREDLTAEETRVTVMSTLALLNSTALVETKVPPDRLRALLRRMALSALLSR